MMCRIDRAPRLLRPGSAFVLALGMAWACTAKPGAAETQPPVRDVAAWSAKWHFIFEIPPQPRPSASPWFDLALTPAVYDVSQPNLADLRLLDPDGNEVPYDLRVLRGQSLSQSIPAREFNRAVGPNDSAELSLDLGDATFEHNEIRVELPGNQYRRQARLEGSTDGSSWRLLAEKSLIHFERGSDRIDDRSLAYPPSRFRYLRLRVERDPLVDQSALVLKGVQVLRTVEAPGELLTLDATLIGKREPVRAQGDAGSAWVIDLGGARVPCARIECDFAESALSRYYQIESVETLDENEPYRFVASGTWRRASGEESKPLVADFNETRARRLRLTITDASNPPLELRAVRFRAPARVVILPRTDSTAGMLRLYSGNPHALAPRYDFAGNLPARLDPAPERRPIAGQHDNPSYVPDPVPLTERLPWLIYAVLGTGAVVLGLMVIDLARQVIARQDADANKPKAAV